MKFTPVSEESANDQPFELWPDGVYDFEVKEAEETQSKAGNDMIALQLWVFNKAGQRRIVFDYLVSSEKAAWKIRSFAASCGMLRRYEDGELDAEEIVGQCGKLVLATQKADMEWPAKNTVKAYEKAEAKAAAPRTARVPAREKTPAGDIDDEIPF